ncbi:hypothetical protein IAD21_00167 [Abditibacteriota bacterium]|nr:hypothetical protein IAD21_00167 [Abditibacteriota bacterium]
MFVENVIALYLEFPPYSDGGQISGLVDVTPLRPSLYRLEEIPFASFVEEATFGDVIEMTQYTPDKFVFQQVIQRSRYKPTTGYCPN